MLKIDVEGHEPETVDGLRRFLANGNRPVIWCEVRGDLSGRREGSYRPVISTLTEYGYIAIDPERWVETSDDDPELANRQVFDLLFAEPVRRPKNYAGK